MSRIIHKERERGQIIVLLAVSVVVVMVVAALAVDGGMIYSERRFAQNAADSAAFAGGGAILNSDELDEALVCPASSSDSMITTIVSQAQARAFANNISELDFKGYEKNIEDFIPDENQGIWVVCNDESETKTIDVIVRVTSQVSTAFAHLIYPGPLQTTNESFVTVSQKGALLSGDAIISLGPGCGGGNGGIIFQNAGLVLNVDGSGVFSNTCLDLHQNLDPNLITVDGGFNIVGEIIGTEPKELVNQTTTGLSPLPKGYPNPPNPKDDCEELKKDGAKDGKINKDTTLSQGYYPGGIKISGANTVITLSEGLYCVGTEFDLSSGTIQGSDVTIYMYDYAEMKMNGNGVLKLVAPKMNSILAVPYIGLLFYIDGEHGSITWNGGDGTFVSGLFYAPERNITYSGNSDNTNGKCPDINGLDCNDITYPTQFVGNQFTFAGSSTVNIDNTGKKKSALINNLFLKD